MFNTIDILFGWMPNILATLCRASLVIFVAFSIFLVVKFIKEIIPFV